ALKASEFYLPMLSTSFSSYFVSQATPTTQISTLSLHDALPICAVYEQLLEDEFRKAVTEENLRPDGRGTKDIRQLSIEVGVLPRSEEHTSELQSRSDLVCRLLLEKKNRLAKYGSSELLPRRLLP